MRAGLLMTEKEDESGKVNREMYLDSGPRCNDYTLFARWSGGLSNAPS